MCEGSGSEGERSMGKSKQQDNEDTTINYGGGEEGLNFQDKLAHQPTPTRARSLSLCPFLSHKLSIHSSVCLRKKEVPQLLVLRC